MSEPNQPRQFVENEWVRRFRENCRKIGRELPPPQDLVPDFMRPLFMKESHQVTTPAPTLQPLLPTSQPVPQSPDSDDSDSSDEETGITTPTEEEVHQEGKSNGSQPEIGFAIQQRIKQLEEEESRLVSARQQQKIASFKDALEVPLQVVGSKAAERFLVGPSGTTVMQLFYDHIVMAHRKIRADTEKVLAANPHCTFPESRGMSVHERERAFKMLQLLISKASAQPTLTETTNPRHKPRFYAVLGGPGSGKSTICASWANVDSGVMHIAIGDILRNEAQRPGSPYAQVLKDNLAKGAIGDPEMTVGLIKDHIRTKLRSATGPIRTYLLDGFPRAFASAQYFERTVGPISGVIILDIPEATLINRCRQRKRSDDNEDAIRERIRVYNTKSAEVIAAYALLGKVYRLSEPPDSTLMNWAGYWDLKLDYNSPFNVDIDPPVFRDVVACGLLIWELCDIRDDCTELNAR